MDERLRRAERALVADPQDQEAAAVVHRGRGRAGLCPACSTPLGKLGPSSMCLSGSPLCRACYLEHAVARLEELGLSEARRRLAFDDRVWVGSVARSVFRAVSRAIRGEWPAISSGVGHYALDGTTRPALVYRNPGPPSRCLYPTTVANREARGTRPEGLIVVGFGVSERLIGSEGLGVIWPELQPKQEMHKGAYVVAHGRPVYEKNLHERLRDWADAEPRLELPLESCRIKAPKEAWRTWRDAWVAAEKLLKT